MAGSRNVRTFLSSTFRDMHAERDHLIKVTFPALRERLLPHRVELYDIDLRWGITEDEARNEKVIRLCLGQVGECRPFFLAFLGDQYGWVPGRIPADATAKYPFVAQFPGVSLTDLELLSLLACARRGLSGHELVELKRHLKEAAGDLYPLLRQLEAYLHRRDGRHDFYQMSIRRAVERHYLKWRAEEDQHDPWLRWDPNRQPLAGDPTEPEVETRDRLIAWFQSERTTARAIDGLPWQMPASGRRMAHFVVNRCHFWDPAPRERQTSGRFRWLRRRCFFAPAFGLLPA